MLCQELVFAQKQRSKRLVSLPGSAMGVALEASTVSLGMGALCGHARNISEAFHCTALNSRPWGYQELVAASHCC